MTYEMAKSQEPCDESADSCVSQVETHGYQNCSKSSA